MRDMPCGMSRWKSPETCGASGCLRVHQLLQILLVDRCGERHHSAVRFDVQGIEDRLQLLQTWAVGSVQLNEAGRQARDIDQCLGVLFRTSQRFAAKSDHRGTEKETAAGLDDARQRDARI